MLEWYVCLSVGEVVVVGRHIQGRIVILQLVVKRLIAQAFIGQNTSVAAPNHRAGSGRELSGRQGF